jgi:hypothetical protein
MASMPPRMFALKDSVPSILHQCQHLYVYLNNFEGYLPPILNNKKITVFFSERELGDTGDVGKFYNCESWEEGFHCTVDDKIIYPNGYSEYMMDRVEAYNRKAVVSLHGRNFHTNRKSESYYRDISELFQCTSKTQEQFVHEIGTGVMCFHTDTVLPEWNWFPYMNMTDIYMSMELQKRNIPMLIAAHPDRYVKISANKIGGYGICNHLRRKDEFQTKVINSVDWKINKV